jgi:hypothetical protein
MALPVSFVSETIADNTVKGNGEPETSTLEFPIITLTAANYVAQSSAIAAAIAAIGGVILGNKLQDTTVILRESTGTGPASSNLAQRENKWLVRYHGDTLNKKFRFSIPTADLSLLPNHSEFLDLSAGAGQTLKNTLEAILRSPDDGAETCTVDSVQFVGRNT